LSGVLCFGFRAKYKELSADHQRLEQVKQNKLRALAMLRQGRREAENTGPAAGGGNGREGALTALDLPRLGVPG